MSRRPLGAHLSRIAVLAALACLVDGCGAKSPLSVTRAPDAAATPDGGTDGGGDAGVGTSVARVVILVSLDGLRADAITPDGMPFLYAQRELSASTLNARCDPTSSVTIPNHLCMATGRPMEGPEGHHFSSNRYVDTILHEQRGFYVQSLFDVAHDRGVTTALVSGKPKFGVIAHAYDGDHGAEDVIGEDDGRAKIDYVHIEAADDDETLAAGLDILANMRLPALMFLHLSDPDHTGHGEDFDPTPGTPYADAARRTDDRVAELVAKVAEMPSLAGVPVSFVLTSDHGGHGSGHYDLTNPVDTSIGFFTWGAGVSPGDLYEINADRRRDPGGEAQPPGDPPPIRNCEAGNVALSLMDLPAIEGSVFDSTEELKTR